MKSSVERHNRWWAWLVVVALVGGCSSIYQGGNLRRETPPDANIIANSYQATERLIVNSQQPMDKEKPILVASLVNVANLEVSSDLGRIISEQISSRLTQLGYLTREMKVRGSFLIKQGGGEFVLSRAIKDISKQQEAQAVITGVYAVADSKIFITLRLIRSNDFKVVGSYDYFLPMGPDTAALLDPYDLEYR